MINGTPEDFLDTAYSGQEIFFWLEGKKYMLQGYTDGKDCCMELQQHIPWNSDSVWIIKENSMLECLKRLEKEPLFNEKSFWNIEQEIEWVDA